MSERVLFVTNVNLSEPEGTNQSLTLLSHFSFQMLQRTKKSQQFYLLLQNHMELFLIHRNSLKLFTQYLRLF